MIESLRKVVNLNMVNRIYSNATGGKIDFVVEEESGENAKIAAMAEGGYLTSYIITKQQTVIDTQNYQIYIDDQSAEGEVDDTQMVLDAEIIEEINAEFGWNLDNSWIGGHVYICVVQNFQMIVGDYLFEIDSDDITLSTTITIPVQYLLVKITTSEQSGGFEYYVAIRNTEGTPTDWNYTGTTFYYNGSATTEIGISEQDPSVPVTWSPDWVWTDLSDESKQELEPYRYCEGYELYTLGQIQGYVYYTYGDSESNRLTITTNMIDDSTLSSGEKYVYSGSTYSIESDSSVTITDYIELLNKQQQYITTYHTDDSTNMWIEIVEFNAQKQPNGLYPVYIHAVSPDYDGNYSDRVMLDGSNDVPYVRLQWRTDNVSNVTFKPYL